MQAARPKYFEIRCDRRPQTEVQPGIVTREKAGLTQQGLSLCLPSVARQNSSPDRAAIGFYALELDFDPVCLASEVVSQQRWRFIEIDDDHVDVAIIIEVSESATAAAMQGGNTGTRFCNQLFKYALP